MPSRGVPDLALLVTRPATMVGLHFDADEIHWHSAGWGHPAYIGGEMKGTLNRRLRSND